MEQEEYTKEEIDWSYIEFIDNQDVLDLIEKVGCSFNLFCLHRNFLDFMPLSFLSINIFECQCSLITATEIKLVKFFFEIVVYVRANMSLCSLNC